MKCHLFAIIFSFCLWQTPVVFSDAEISKEHAIVIAEKFIVLNGYTEAENSSIKEKLDYESISFAEDKRELLEQRFNSLKQKAYGAVMGRKNGAPGWTVAFEFTDDFISRYKKYTGTKNNVRNSIGRAVTMNMDGTDIRVEHVDVFLSKFRIE